MATRSQIQALADFTECPPEKIQLQAMLGEDDASMARYKEDVLTRRKSLIDLLEEFPACQLPFEVYLEMLPALRPRYYSISSSPLADERTCSITVAVIDAPARSGRGVFQGVCTNYLARQNEADVIYAYCTAGYTVFDGVVANPAVTSQDGLSLTSGVSRFFQT